MGLKNEILELPGKKWFGVTPELLGAVYKIASPVDEAIVVLQAAGYLENPDLSRVRVVQTDQNKLIGGKAIGQESGIILHDAELIPAETKDTCDPSRWNLTHYIRHFGQNAATYKSAFVPPLSFKLDAVV